MQLAFQKITTREYLLAEERAVQRHQYIDGSVVAMAGESPTHGDITANLAGLLVGQLRDTPCRAKIKDTRVRSGPPGPRPLQTTRGMYSYPDLVVVCGEPEYESPGDTLTNPTAIFEVLSPSTEALDRGAKFDRYALWNATLGDYLLVSQHQPLIEHFARQPDGSWLYRTHRGLEAEFIIPTIGCTVRLAEVYARVQFAEAEAGD